MQFVPISAQTCSISDVAAPRNPQSARDQTRGSRSTCFVSYKWLRRFSSSFALCFPCLGPSIALTVTSEAMAGPQSMCVICSWFLGSSYTRLFQSNRHTAGRWGGQRTGSFFVCRSPATIKGWNRKLRGATATNPKKRSCCKQTNYLTCPPRDRQPPARGTAPRPCCACRTSNLAHPPASARGGPLPPAAAAKSQQSAVVRSIDCRHLVHFSLCSCEMPNPFRSMFRTLNRPPLVSTISSS